MTYTDSVGYAISTSSSEALAAYEQGVNLWLRWRGGSVEALDKAVALDPQCALAHCTRVYVAWRMNQGGGSQLRGARRLPQGPDDI